MSIFDALKNSVLEGFEASLTTGDILMGLLASLLAGIFILIIYRTTSATVSVSRSFGLTLLLITSISAMIVLTITSNLALSLGMVGALSIVRFRTAIKDASDTAFLFWAVAAGITSGAGFYLLTLIGCLFIGAICLVSLSVLNAAAKSYLLVVRAADGEAADRVQAVLERSKMGYRLSALTENPGYTEIIYELAFNDKKKGAILSMRNIPGVKTVSLVDCKK